MTLDLAKSLLAAGHQPHILAYAEPENLNIPSSKAVLQKESEWAAVPITYVNYSNIEARAELALHPAPSMKIFAHDFLKRHKFSLLHVTHPIRTLSFIKAARLLRVPYVLTLNDYFLMCPQIQLLNLKNENCSGPEKGVRCDKDCRTLQYKSKDLQKRFVIGQTILAQAHARVCPSEYVSGRFRTAFPKLTFSTLPCGTTFRKPSARIRKYTSRSSVHFTYLGSLQKPKGLQIIIAALGALPHHNWKLSIHGPMVPPEKFALDLLALAWRDKRIRFYGPYEERALTGILNKTDVLCFPSLWHEIFGIVVEEAFSANLPVIASKVGAVSERVLPDQNGLLLPAGNILKWRQAFTSILDNPTILNRWKKSAKPYSTTDQVGAQHEALYERTLASGLNQ